MKLLSLLVLLFCVSANAGDRQDKMLEFAKSLKTGDCFRYEYDYKAQHNFEKSHLIKDNIHVVLAVDSKGLLIAQPNPECKQSSENSHKCEYWFRTVSFASPFLVTENDVKITCPPQLSRKALINRLKNSGEANRYNIKKLQESL